MIQAVAASSALKGAGDALKAIPKEVWYGLFILLTLVIVWKKGAKLISNGRQSKYVKGLDTNNKNGRAAEYASRLYGAFIQTRAWLNDISLWNYTDEKEAFIAAKAIHDDSSVTFSDVEKAYKILYGRSLLEEINKEFDAEENKDFFNTLKTGKIPTKYLS